MSCKDITQFIFVCRTLKSPLKQQKETIDRLVVRSSKMRVPSDFQKFMNNNNNKGRLSEIIEETLLSHNNTSIDMGILSQEETPGNYFQEVMVMLHSL